MGEQDFIVGPLDMREIGRDIPISAHDVIQEVDTRLRQGGVAHFRPLATGFEPLDSVLNGGIRPGELMIVGGPFGVGKTIFCLQMARNAARAKQGAALYVCYEHSPTHLLSRLLCLESAERGHGRGALTLPKVEEMMSDFSDGGGLLSKLRDVRRYADMMDDMESYMDHLFLTRAGGTTITVDRIESWVKEILGEVGQPLLLVIDYIQKIPTNEDRFRSESDSVTYVVQALKEIAVSNGIQVAGIAASSRRGLQANRMRLSDLRGSSALQYETDIGMILNNKYDVISREHLVYNLQEAEQMRRWLVMSIEKNRAGAHAIDLEFQLDAQHFHLAETGDFVRERLVDDRVVLA
ncbi:MAG: DnaB-like helicase C-terminal domain-containing protein [Chloroflexota bacterium]|nr:DnaB-like helicase C-terminal domain-containing protein [Chloroflexota bacterium]